MREIYLWTGWFTKLATKIAADDGKVFLMEHAGNVNNLSYGDLNVDPFSFVHNLAKQGSVPERRNQVFPSVNDIFGMGTPIPVDCDDAFIFPPYAFTDTVEVFSSRLGDDSELLWHLFRAAVRRPENVEEYFNRVLEIGGVTIEKLTQALFLINPSTFLPYDDVTRSLGIHGLQEAVNWTQYQEELQRFRHTFPGCEFYEVNLFAYLCKSGKLPIRDKYFQVSTRAWGIGETDLWNGDDPQLDQYYFEPNNWVFTGGGPDMYPAMRDPRRGDVILVRTGWWQGRGIGIVYKNDHEANENRIHVVWVNKEPGRLRRQAPTQGFTRAWGGTIDAFRHASGIGETFELLDRLSSREDLMADERKAQNSDEEHPCNQILYGPPGTGKTY